MSRLRVVTSEDIKKSDMTPLVRLKHVGEVYTVMGPCERGLDLAFVRFATVSPQSSGGLPQLLASMGAQVESSPVIVPKVIYATQIHLNWLERFFGVNLKRKTTKVISRWGKKLLEFDAILGETNSKYISTLAEE